MSWYSFTLDLRLSILLGGAVLYLERLFMLL